MDLVIQLRSWVALGGNTRGCAVQEPVSSWSPTLWNSVAGIIGGGVGGQILAGSSWAAAPLRALAGHGGQLAAWGASR